MNVPTELFYAKSHEWVKYLGGGRALVGVSDHAQEEMGDVVFVNLCDDGDALEIGEVFGDVESIKAVSDLYAPVSGKVLRVNEALLESPERINEAPYDSWLIELEDVTENAELLDAAAYTAMLEAEI